MMVTSFADDESLYASVMAGTSGYILEQIKPLNLIADVTARAAGESLLDPMAVAKVVERIANPPKVDQELASLEPPGTANAQSHTQGKRDDGCSGGMLPWLRRAVTDCVTELVSKLHMTSRTEAAMLRHEAEDREVPCPETP